MKVGLTRYGITEEYPSLKYCFTSLERALQQQHEIVYYPLEAKKAPMKERRVLAAEFVAQCDVVVDRDNLEIYEARKAIGKPIPIAHLLLGDMPRGGLHLAILGPMLTDEDVLIASCQADADIASKLLAGAKIQRLPFAIDSSVFEPTDPQHRSKWKRELGLFDTDLLLVYAGRITIEKNIHSLIRVFAKVVKVIPNTHLVIVGDCGDNPFLEFGVYPRDFSKTLRTYIRDLQIPENHIQFHGNTDSHRLRQIYSAADLFVNLTLHHDENFGFAQVEAMGCGTPVVGTGWGGLKETIIDGVTGYQIYVLLSETGIKVDWWQAADRIVHLLQNQVKRDQFRQNSVEHVRSNYTFPIFSANLLRLVEEMLLRKHMPCHPLKPTPFAAQLWFHCLRTRQNATPPYRQGTPSFHLYQDLIAPYTTSSKPVYFNETTTLVDGGIYLAHPVTYRRKGQLYIHDPLYPTLWTIPPLLEHTVFEVLNILSIEPIVSITKTYRTRLRGML